MVRVRFRFIWYINTIRTPRTPLFAIAPLKSTRVPKTGMLWLLIGGTP